MDNYDYPRSDMEWPRAQRDWGRERRHSDVSTCLPAFRNECRPVCWWRVFGSATAGKDAPSACVPAGRGEPRWPERASEEKLEAAASDARITVLPDIMSLIGTRMTS